MLFLLIFPTNGAKSRHPTLLCHVAVGECSGLSAHALLVVGSVLAVGGVSLCLSRVLDVGIVEEILDADQELFDGDGRPPILVLVQETQADGSGWINVGVEQRRAELDLGRGGWEVLFENHVAFVEAAFPRSPLLSGNGKLPLHQVQGAVGVLGWAGDESEGVIFTPLLSLL